VTTLPTISMFFGILIAMYWREHGPPHFHAKYGGHEAIVDIETGDVLEGHLPPRAAMLVREWAQLHRDELRDNWHRCRRNERPNTIAPLE
jgi:hypothetical protein